MALGGGYGTYRILGPCLRRKTSGRPIPFETLYRDSFRCAVWSEDLMIVEFVPKTEDDTDA